MKKLSIITASVLAAAAVLTGCNDSSSSVTSVDSSAEIKLDTGSAADSSSEEETAPTYKSIKLMTCGDSITDGFWLEGGYRKFLCDKLEENGLSQYVDFVGSKKGGECYDNEHEGYTGWSIDRIEESITGSRMGVSNILPKRIEKFQPDVVTLMIGTNDILSNYELDTAGDRLSALIDAMLEKMPEGSVLFLATLPDMDATNNTYIDKDTFTVEYMDKCISDYNYMVKGLVDKKKQEGKNIRLADVSTVLVKSDLYDGVHPSEEGYKKLADFWYDTITAYMAE
ncbi:SGNH/GDSL hydrolase family protein [Ruminococcus sp. NK3A76]|uniref:SGNH/GDSL hydrolase family protein n=1 Tax=Ruminococcus sp. NK3A76 TaxID=877411 RepID=UPI00048FB518|nr:SGNH/GDSL hydrolase family protein [Ruminococcus sp. NK3A76]